MKITMILADWESLVLVMRNFKAESMTLTHVVHLQKVSELIEEKIGEFAKKKTDLVQKGQDLIAEGQRGFDELRAKYIGQPTHPDVIAYTNGINQRIQTEINDKIRELEMEQREVEIPDNWFESLQNAYVRQAYFGEGGYLDNHLGRAAFVRTLQALQIPIETVEALDKERVTHEQFDPNEELKKD